MLPLLTRTALALAAAAAVGQAAAAVNHIADLSLEQLSELEVTSVSKRGQKLAEVAGSVFVIRRGDILQSGAQSLADALRLAPNLYVAQVDAGQYAITARTGADVLSNKLLVLVDGRTIYSPLFSGVFWEAQDLVLDDIERIEVLSGSGGTLYGSNAFNGVINVITRAAGHTAGTFVRAAAGERQEILALRHGFASEDGDAAAGLRLYAKRRQADASTNTLGSDVADATRHALAGFRLDRGTDAERTTVHGGVFHHEAGDPQGRRAHRGIHLVARHNRVAADGSSIQWQGYFDRFVRERSLGLVDEMDTWDLEFQRLSVPAVDHLRIWGGGVRHHRDHATNSAAVSLIPPRRNLHLANVFVQDEWTRDTLKLTAGLKAEHNSYTGMEYLPNLRAAWDVAPGQLLWAAWSRVVRTPSRVDRETVAPPLRVSPGFQSEVARVTEVGYRGRLLSAASVSATVFHHAFDRVRSVDPVPEGVAFGNNYRGRLTGIEAWTEFSPLPGWRVQAGGMRQHASYEVAGGRPLRPLAGNDPSHRLSVNSYLELGRGVNLFLGVRRVGSLPQPAVAAYTAVDARLGWQVSPQVELSVLGKNLNGRHAEWSNAPTAAQLRRSLLLQAIVRL